jgi:hypothetical protein
MTRITATGRVRDVEGAKALGWKPEVGAEGWGVAT